MRDAIGICCGRCGDVIAEATCDAGWDQVMMRTMRRCRFISSEDAIMRDSKQIMGSSVTGSLRDWRITS